MTNAIVPIKNELTAPENKQTFIDILGERGGAAFIASVINLVAQDEKLQECTPISIVRAAIRAASYNLPIDPGLGMACILPYNNRKTGQKEAQYQTMKNGYIQLGLRTGLFETLNADTITEGETISKDKITGKYTITGEERGEITHYFSYFRLLNGYEKMFIMSVKEIQDHGKKYAPGSYGKPWSKWTTDFPVMAIKTVLKLNLKHNAPLEVGNEARQLLAKMDDEDGPQDLQPLEDDNGDYIEAEFVEAKTAPEDVRGPNGGRLGDLNDSQLEAVKDSKKYNEEIRKAAALVIENRIKSAQSEPADF